MKRRNLLGFIVAALAAPCSVLAQQTGRVYRIGFLGSASLTPEQFKNLPLVQGLAERGWIEGQNIVFERRAADGKNERFPELAADLVRLKVDVIVTVGVGVAAARKATQTIPIVAFGVNEPIMMGFAQSYARPGGNVTGLTFEAGLTIDSKSFELLKEAVPSARRVALLTRSASELIRRPYLVGIPPVAKALSVELLVVEVNAPEEFESAFARMKEGRADALFVPGDALYLFHRVRIAELALKHRLPMGGPSSQLAEAGGLIGFSPDFSYNLRRAADYVDKILKGANPGDMPFEQPSKFELVVNLKTAKLLGLTVPQSLLLRAGRVIE